MRHCWGETYTPPLGQVLHEELPARSLKSGSTQSVQAEAVEEAVLGLRVPRGQGMQASVEIESLYEPESQSEHVLEESGPWPVAQETRFAMEIALLFKPPSQPIVHVPLGGVRESEVIVPAEAQVESPSMSLAATTEGSEVAKIHLFGFAPEPSHVASQ